MTPSTRARAEFLIATRLKNLDATHQYIEALRTHGPAEPPEILIELFFEDIDDLAAFKDTNNSLRESAPGVKIRIAFDADSRLSDRAAPPDPVGHAGSRTRSTHHRLVRRRNGR